MAMGYDKYERSKDLAELRNRVLAEQAAFPEKGLKEAIKSVLWMDREFTPEGPARDKMTAIMGRLEKLPDSKAMSFLEALTGSGSNEMPDDYREGGRTKLI